MSPRWYPLRICHSSVKRQSELNELLKNEPTVERTYVPMNLVDADDMTYVPALVNYVFVRTTLEDLRTLKADKVKYNNLRYVMNRNLNEEFLPVTEIAYVPDKQMEDFIRVTETANEQVVQLQNMEFACKPGQRVKIRKGLFEGVEGIVKSIKKHLCVVIPITGVMAVAITNVPKKFLQKCEDAPSAL